MSATWLALGLLLGVDSFAVCVALGAVQPTPVKRYRLALAFGLCDGLASLAGSVLGVASLGVALVWSEWLAPAAIGGYGVYVFALSRLATEGATRLRQSWLLFALPFFLSLDNFFAGIGQSASGSDAFFDSLALGAISGGLSLLGLVFGTAVAFRYSMRSSWRQAGLFLLAGVLSCSLEILF